MREFSKISPAIWSSERFRKAPDDAKFLIFYMMTCAHQNSCGCFVLPDGYAAVDLAWPADRYVTARNALVDADLISFDAETSEVLVKRWFQHCAPMNPSHEKAITRSIEGVHSDVLRAEAESALDTALEAARAKREAKLHKKQTLASVHPLTQTAYFKKGKK